MNARIWMGATAGAAVLLAGCGGDDGGGEKRAAKPSAPPAAKEPLAAAAKRLEAALPGKDCKALAPLMLHSVTWGREPNAPPTARECRYIDTEARTELRGFEVGRTQEFGPAGLTEGGGDRPRPGEVVGVIWVLDRDGSWKVVFDATFRRQIGPAPEYGTGFEANAGRFVTAVASGNCDDFWRLLNVSSRFVRGRVGDKGEFCRGLAPVYRDRKSAFAQIKADPDAKPQELGKVRDIGFYGLPLENGRYLVLVLAGRIGGYAVAEQKEHGNPSVLEFVTVRRATG